MQLAVIEFARNVCGVENAGSSEFSTDITPFVGLLTEWVNHNKIEKRSKDDDLGGTMRLGSYPCKLLAGSLIEAIYRVPMIMKDTDIGLKLIWSIKIF